MPRRLQRFKLLVDAGFFLDLPANSPAPPPPDSRLRTIARALDSAYKASWDPDCAAAQLEGEAWRCFHAQYWPSTAGSVPVMFVEPLYDLAHIGEHPFRRAPTLLRSCASLNPSGVQRYTPSGALIPDSWLSARQ